MEENPYKAPLVADELPQQSKERWRFSRTKWRHWTALFFVISWLLGMILKAIRGSL
jgi:hypothetical protein